jgi:hypothetical protein
MTPEIQSAIREIVQAYPACAIETADDPEGGAYVTVKDMVLAGPYTQDKSWIGFRITHTYPYADIYPHFIRADLSRRDGKALGEATSVGQFRGQPAIQISRRSNRHNPVTDTALIKLEKVVRWLNSRP